MKIEELCDFIELQKPVSEQVKLLLLKLNWKELKMPMQAFGGREKWENALEQIGTILAPDEKNMKMLTCMLAYALKTYENYCDKGIDKKIFVDTMKCFSRFIEECYEMTGEYAFDRVWWTPRQLSMSLFRLGELEYEMDTREKKLVVSIHIPSDTKLTVENCDQSLKEAKVFFQKYFPEYVQADYICDSWLLSPALKELLPASSKILQFQQRFHITATYPDDQEFITFAFQSKNRTIRELPEKTSLQRNMKKYLLAGGKVGSASGVLLSI